MRGVVTEVLVAVRVTVRELPTAVLGDVFVAMVLAAGLDAAALWAAFFCVPGLEAAVLWLDPDELVWATDAVPGTEIRIVTTRQVTRVQQLSFQAITTLLQDSTRAFDAVLCARSVPFFSFYFDPTGREKFALRA